MLISIPGPVSHEWTTSLKGQGMPTSERTDPRLRGSLIVYISRIVYPDFLTREQMQGVGKLFSNTEDNRATATDPEKRVWYGDPTHLLQSGEGKVKLS